MPSSKSKSLLSVAQEHWMQFLPAWLFPLFFFWSIVLAERLGYMIPFVLLIIAPAFYVSFSRAVRPWTSGATSLFPVVFWAMLVPFAIWAVTVFVNLRVLGVSP